MEQQHNSHALTNRGKLSGWTLAVYAFLSVGAIVLSLPVSRMNFGADDCAAF